MATKGKNSTTEKKSSSKSKTTAKGKQKAIKDEPYNDPYLKEVTKEIILWVSIAIGVLLTISNFGIGGFIGTAVSGALFGVFGIIQFVLPVVTVIAAFFIISNYGNIIAVIKVVFGFLLLQALSLLSELIIHGRELYTPAMAFEYSKINHTGGGFIGGFFSELLVNSFGVVGAFFINLILIIICSVIIFEKFVFDKLQHSSRYHADKAANKRIERIKRQELERAVDKERLEAERNARQKRIKDELERQNSFEEAEGPRINNKRKGITTNTLLSGTNYEDLKEEIASNALDEKDIVSSKRTRLTSSKKNSKSSISLNVEPIIPEVVPVNTVQMEPVISTPIIHTPEPVDTSEPSEKHVSSENVISKPVVKSEAQKKDASVDNAVNIKTEENKPTKPYRFPPLNLLNEPKKGGGDSKEYLTEMAAKLQRTLYNFGVSANVTNVTPGPSVTRYEIEIAEGTKVSKVVNLSDDIKLNMAVTDVRIEAPIPGKSAIGIEVPNKEKTLVGFRELVSSKVFKESKSNISFCVGKDISGQVIVGNIEKMPHLLIAGATGSGKSVCINTIIMSILYHADPQNVKLIMVDPKMVELSVYNGIPHLLLPVITDAKKAAGALHWAVKEMTDRYELMQKVGVRNITGYNEKYDAGILSESFPEDNMQRMTQIVIILDELADLMMVAASDVEDSIVRLAQLARACGIHLIIATQRPTANVITGLIKANVPSRIAFSVASGTDSRVILDMTGAEDLLGYCDMLYSPQDLSKPIRVQGAFVSDEEVSKVVEYIKNNNDSSTYDNKINEAIESSSASGGNSVSIGPEPDDSKDNLFAEAGRLVIENQKGSIGYLQRNFRIGFNRAARIMDQLCEAGVVGPEVGTKPREIRMSLVEFEEYLQLPSE